MKKQKVVPAAIDQLDPRKHIIIKGARVHNLKNVSVSIPRNQMVVITGLSGSGKSSLAFDTLFAEGQRRYVESLSSYARQFLGRLDKPEVDTILGISPAVAIEQKVTSRTSRSTVGTTTEIYDYLKLLFSRIGRTYSPVSGQEVKRDRPTDVREYIFSHEENTRFYLLAPVQKPKGYDAKKKLETLGQQGFSRIKFNGEYTLIEEVIEKAKAKDEIFVVIDRLTASQDEDNQTRIIDSCESAFFEGAGECAVENADSKKVKSFSNRFEADGIEFEEPSLNLFSFNNPVGACKTCEGFGSIIGIDENLVVPDKRLSIYQEAIACWRGEKMSEWKDQLVMKARKFDFPIHKPWNELTAAQRDLVWSGNEHFAGLNAFFQFIESESYKIQYRVMLSRYRGKTKCPDCKGTRLRKDANYVKVGGRNITELVTAPIGEILPFFKSLKLNAHEQKVAQRLLLEITNRLSYLGDVGLEYLTLNRLSNTLSGGESQRINLATSLGSSLVGSMYILDEPSIGLHPRDTDRLIGVLKQLKEQGNTVIIVEHDEKIMRASDNIIDMGPEAGSFGGEITFTGTTEELIKSGKTLTADYLTGRKSIDLKPTPKNLKNKVIIRGARENNLKNIDVEFPLQCFTVVSGVSGSGKSTLIRDILYPALKKSVLGLPEPSGEYDAIEGDLSIIKSVEFVDQNPIGKSSRSNPVTYVKAYDEIRTLFANQTLSKHRAYKPSHFSFNVEGGRCESCEGEGYQTIEMQFMADIKLVCDTCKGKRFKDEVLEVEYRGKNISDVLDMTVDDAVTFFGADEKNAPNKNLLQKLQPLQQVGLGYIGLGQSSSSLSGGEAQRIKLASFLTKGQSDTHTVFIFDEPTTGLHFHDVRKLMESFKALLDRGHTIIAIEHNTDVMKCADWLIDIGPEGGDAGGNLVYTGPPAGISKVKKSHTASYL
ncbi:MAG: excinuclease subunit UvrA [Bacteroidota bacterium]|jgi:excinuclease ABC subunit A